MDIPRFDETAYENDDTAIAYKQLAHFDEDDYLTAIMQWTDRALYAARKANTFVDRCNRELNTQYPKPFPGAGVLADYQHNEF